MTKTIEELAKQYAEDMCPIGDYCGGVYDEQRNCDLPIYIDDAKSVLEWLFNKPLAQRLTAEEKERIKKMYKRMELDAQHSDSYDCIPSSDMEDAIEALESIFGKEFFKDSPAK